MTLSTPVKVVALAGLALILGAGGLLVLASKHHSTPSTQPPVAQAPAVKVVQVSAPVTHPARPAKPKIQLDPALPAPVRAKLERSREVVAIVYTGASASDRAELAEVRAGAHAAHVPFVALDVTKEPIADSVYAWTSSSADPAVLVVTRPGTIVFALTGVTDRQTIASAAASAR